MKRTQYIIELSKKLEKQKNIIFNPLNSYLKILERFIKDKKFSIDIEKSGELIVQKGNQIIDIEYLSSGEKQLIVLLTETLLQKQLPFTFIADEPELSLHIEWQRILLSSIRELNSNAQIIVATHSPEIAGLWKDNLIDMEKIFYD